MYQDAARRLQWQPPHPPQQYWLQPQRPWSSPLLRRWRMQRPWLQEETVAELALRQLEDVKVG